MVPGNHDSRNVGYVHFEELFGPRARDAAQGRRVDRRRGLLRARPRPRPDRPQPLPDDRGGSSRSPADLRIFVLHHHLLPIPGTGRERNIVYDAGDLLEVLLRSRRQPRARRAQARAVRVAARGPVRRHDRHRLDAAPARSHAALLQRDRDRPGAGADLPQVPVRRAGADHRVLARRPHEYEKAELFRRRGGGHGRSARRDEGHRADRRRAPSRRSCATRSTGCAAEHEIAAVLFVGRRGEGARAAVLDDPRAHYGRDGDDRRPASPRAALRELAAARPAEAVVDLSGEPVLDARTRACGWRRSRSTSGSSTARRAAADAAAAASDLDARGAGRGRDRDRQADRQDGASAAISRRCCADAGSEPVSSRWGGAARPQPQLVRRGRGCPASRSCSRSPARGGHAASDYLEDAVLAGVTTRRLPALRRGPGGRDVRLERRSRACGSRCALEPGVVVLEGSGAALPPVAAHRTVCVDERRARARAGAVAPGPAAAAALGPASCCSARRSSPTAGARGAGGRSRRRGCPRERIVALRPASPSRPSRCPPARAWRVFTTARPEARAAAARAARSGTGSSVRAVSSNLARRDGARARPRAGGCASGCDVFLTELKAAAIDIVAEQRRAQRRRGRLPAQPAGRRSPGEPRPRRRAAASCRRAGAGAAREPRRRESR